MVITTNQIRTGNIFLYDVGADSDGVGAELQPTTLDWQDIKWCEEKNEEFNRKHKPMPLTEDWLLRFGFEKVISVTFRLDLTGVRTLELIVVLQPDNNIVAIHDNYGKEQKEIIFTRTPLQYAHQLQTLHHSLTGLELVIADAKV